MRVSKYHKQRQKRKAVTIPFIVDTDTVVHHTVPVGRCSRWNALISKCKRYSTDPT